MEAFLHHLAVDKNPEQAMLLGFLILLMVVALALLILVMFQFGAVYNILQQRHNMPSWQNQLSDWFGQFYQQQTGLKPMATEKDLLLDHNYDGITELDNHLPPWWKNLFYVTIGFSAVYLFAYNFTGTWESQEQEYRTELALAEEQKAIYEKTQANSISEKTAKFLTDAATLKEGEDIYVSKCVACHAADGGGGVGPNLTDNYWMHGNKVGDVFKTVKEGVPGKGMVAWAGTLNPKQIQSVSSYILSMKGKAPAQPKAPQGQLYADEKPAGDNKSSTAKKAAPAEKQAASL